MAEVTLNTIAAGSGGAGLLTNVIKQQTTVPAGSTIIPISVNGGVLPTSDDRILVSSATGVLQQGAGFGEYQVNRGTTPDQIELNNAPLGPVDFVIQLIYP